MSFNSHIKTRLYFLLRIILSVVFTVSGIAKILNIDNFVLIISQFGFSEFPDLKPIAIGFASLEIITGLMLILGMMRRYALYLMYILLITFLAASIPVLISGEKIDCGCFGPLVSSEVDLWLVVRDVVLLVLILGSLRLEKDGVREPTPRTERSEFRTGNILSSTIFIFALTLTALLILQNMSLSSRVFEVAERRAQLQLKPGEQAAPLQLLAMNGDTLKLQFAETGGRYFLIFFSPICGICEQNMPVLNEIAPTLKSKGANVIGVSIFRAAETYEYYRSHPVSFQIFRIIDPNFQKAYRISEIPVMMYIEYPGIVKKVWHGLLTENDLYDIKFIASLRGNL